MNAQEPRPAAPLALPIARLKWLWIVLAVAAAAVLWRQLFPGAPVSTGQTTETAPALVNQSLQHAQAGRYQQCIETARRALSSSPGDAPAYNNIGWCSAQLGNWDEGLRNIREAVRLDPTLAIAASNLAWMEKNRPAATAPTPANSADAELSASLEHALAGRYTECIETGRRALRIKPDNPLAFNNIGWCTAKLGQWNEGIEYTLKALRLQPNFPRASNNLHWMLEESAKARGQSATK